MQAKGVNYEMVWLDFTKYFIKKIAQSVHTYKFKILYLGSLDDAILRYQGRQIEAFF